MKSNLCNFGNFTPIVLAVMIAIAMVAIPALAVVIIVASPHTVGIPHTTIATTAIIVPIIVVPIAYYFIEN